MIRRCSVLTLAVALTASAGCKHNTTGCTTSNTRGAVPGQLVGSSGSLPAGCYDAVTGMPVPCPPSTGVIPGGYPSYPAVPGVAPGTRPDELPFPAPSDMIRPPGVPYAPPTVAPGEGIGVNAKGGTATKTGK